MPLRYTTFVARGVIVVIDLPSCYVTQTRTEKNNSRLLREGMNWRLNPLTLRV